MSDYYCKREHELSSEGNNMTNIDPEIIDTIELARARILELDPDESAFQEESSDVELLRTNYGFPSDRERSFSVHLPKGRSPVVWQHAPGIDLLLATSLPVLTQRHLELLVDWEMNGGELDLLAKTLTREVPATTRPVHITTCTIRHEVKYWAVCYEIANRSGNVNPGTLTFPSGLSYEQVSDAVAEILASHMKAIQNG